MYVLVLMRRYLGANLHCCFLYSVFVALQSFRDIQVIARSFQLFLLEEDLCFCENDCVH